MQKCPGCNQPAVRFFKEWETLTLRYVHSGFDCVLPMRPGTEASELGVELSKLRAELAKERKIRQQRDRQLQTITRYATGQIYLEEFEEYENKAYCTGCRIGGRICAGGACASFSNHTGGTIATEERNAVSGTVEG